MVLHILRLLRKGIQKVFELFWHSTKISFLFLHFHDFFSLVNLWYVYQFKWATASYLKATSITYLRNGFWKEFLGLHMKALVLHLASKVKRLTKLYLI